MIWLYNTVRIKEKEFLTLWANFYFNFSQYYSYIVFHLISLNYLIYFSEWYSININLIEMPDIFLDIMKLFHAKPQNIASGTVSVSFFIESNLFNFSCHSDNGIMINYKICSAKSLSNKFFNFRHFLWKLLEYARVQND